LRRKWRPFEEGGTLVFDTDIFIWIQRGHVKAARLVDQEEERLVSVQSYMELMQCAENKEQQEYARGFLQEFGFRTLPLSENIGHRAAIYVEQYALSHGLRAADAIIAATAAEGNWVLCSSNARHFKPIKDLKLKVFRP
jgi:predicted nucleic acid-binding protein